MNHTAPNKWKSISFTVVATTLVATVVCYWMFKRGKASLSNPPRTERQNITPASQETEVRSHIQTTIQRIRGASDSTVIRSQFSELRKLLQSLPPAVASQIIQELLDSKVDAVSHLPFKIGSDGFLTEAPSLRVFLLDYLAQVDPAKAAAYAEKILATMESQDEWAVALRNYAKNNSSSEGLLFLEQKLQAMLSHEPWVQAPDVGFLEAFDAAVYLGGTNLIPTLTGLIRKQDNQAVAHAAFLALDRLTIADAAATLSSLQADPDLMQGREATRANYFARADVRDAAQRGLVEAYLLNPALGTAELEQFVGLYPNANFMVSRNLLTPVVTPDNASLGARDAAALRAVREWVADPRFTKLHPELEQVKARLEEFARQSKPAP